MDNYVLENEYLRIEIINPNGNAPHLFSRFNHCGYIKSIFDKESKQQLLSSAQDEFHPFHGEGFPDEFEMPIAYDTAKIGELFLKIGVGLERKEQDCAYTNWDMHKVMKTAKTEVILAGNGITFIQSLHFGEYGYHYEKRVELIKKRFVISHVLRNIGKKQLDTLWYSHAFIPVHATNEAISLMLADKYRVYNNGNLLDGDNPIWIKQTQEILKGTCFNWHVEADAINRQTLKDEQGMYYDSIGDFSFHDLQVYINERVISVEPKLKINLAPNDEKHWSTTYQLTRERE